MRPADDLWVDMVELDFGLNDAVWDGTVPADAPPWVEELVALVAAARAPATAELRGEAAIVDRMAEAVERIPLRSSSPRWRRARMIGAVATIKTTVAIVVAVGAAALATTTGMVVSRVLPGPSEPVPDPPGVSTPHDEPRGKAIEQGEDEAEVDDGPAGPETLDDGERCAAPPAVVNVDCSAVDEPPARKGTTGEVDHPADSRDRGAAPDAGPSAAVAGDIPRATGSGKAGAAGPPSTEPAPGPAGDAGTGDNPAPTPTGTGSGPSKTSEGSGHSGAAPGHGGTGPGGGVVVGSPFGGDDEPRHGGVGPGRGVVVGSPFGGDDEPRHGGVGPGRGVVIGSPFEAPGGAPGRGELALSGAGAGAPEVADTGDGGRGASGDGSAPSVVP